MTGDRSELASLTQPHVLWPTFPLQASCRRSPLRTHKAPAPECTCGVYALNGLEELLEQGLGPPRLLVGSVELWGTVIKGEKGYRAQFARPIILFPGPGQEGDAIEVANRFGIDVSLDLQRRFLLFRGGPLHGRVVPRDSGAPRVWEHRSIESLFVGDVDESPEDAFPPEDGVQMTLPLEIVDQYVQTGSVYWWRGGRLAGSGERLKHHPPTVSG